MREITAMYDADGDAQRRLRHAADDAQRERDRGERRR